jgi:HK97 family phage major capsid protein
MAAAFSKENEDMTTPATTETPAEPAAPPAAPPAVAEKFSAADEKSETYRAAEAFARKQELGDLEAAITNILTGDMTPAKAEAYDAFSAVYDERRKADIEAKDRFERMKLAQAMRLGKLPKAPEAEAGLYASDDYKAAFSRYMRGETTAMEQFAQSIAGDGTQGGYTVPEEFRTKIVETQAAFGGIQQQADLLETSDGRPLPYPTNNDTANSAVVASEGSAPGSAGADLVFGEVQLGAFSIAATGTGNAPLKVSWELLQDSAFDIEGFVARKLGERLGRKAAAYYANGVGTTEPFGLLAKTPDTMSATTMYAALVEHHFQVNEAYRQAGNCRWIMSDTNLAKVWNSLDDNGRPLFQPNAQSSGAGAPAGFLLGYPLHTDQAAALNVAFGDIRQGFVIRRVRAVQVVVDPYNNTATRQNAYHAWMRTDSAVQDSAAYSVSDYTGVSADS